MDRDDVIAEARRRYEDDDVQVLDLHTGEGIPGVEKVDGGWWVLSVVWVPEELED